MEIEPSCGWSRMAQLLSDKQNFCPKSRQRAVQDATGPARKRNAPDHMRPVGSLECRSANPRGAHRAVDTIDSSTAYAKGAIGSLDLDGPLAL